MKLVLLCHTATTLMLVGVIWIVQIVHYPLFNRVGSAAFPRYEADHTILITLIVMPLMLTEVITALILISNPPATINPVLLWIGLGLIVIIWGATFFIQVPLHSTLATGFHENAYRSLVTSNWLRTIAWSMRGALVLWVLSHLLGCKSESKNRVT